MTVSELGVAQNELNFLGNGYISKKFSSAGACFREVRGSNLFANFSLVNLPKVYKASGKECLIEEVQNTRSAYELLNEGTIEMSQVTNFVAELVAKTALNSRSALIPKRMFFSEQFRQIHYKFLTNLKILNSLLNVGELAVLQNEAEIIAQKITSVQDCMTVLHRDIHLSNILIDMSGNFYLIDFEQSAYGPIELEFQNSLLFKDEKSLDVLTIVTLLRNKHGLKYSSDLENLYRSAYIIDQLNQAVVRGMFKKVLFLSDRFFAFKNA